MREFGCNAQSWSGSVFEKLYELYCFRTRAAKDKQSAKITRRYISQTPETQASSFAPCVSSIFS